MKKVIITSIGILALSIVLTGCGAKTSSTTVNTSNIKKTQASSTVENPVVENKSSNSKPAAKQTKESLLAAAKSQAKSIDSAVLKTNPKIVKMEPDYNAFKDVYKVDGKGNKTPVVPERRIVSLYQINGSVSKLAATEPDDAGKMVGLTSYYFKDGKLFYVRDNFNYYVIQDNKIIAIRQISNGKFIDFGENLKGHEDAFIKDINTYLKLFNK